MANYNSAFTGEQVDRAVRLVHDMTENPGSTDSPLLGYLYVGKATPSMNPGIPTTKVCYLALTPGTYRNFNNLIVSEGTISILSWDGSSWSQLDIPSSKDSIGSDFVTNIECGGIAINTPISSTDSLKDIVKRMLLKLKYASISKYPYISLSTNVSTSVEYGTTLKPSHTLSYYDGKFKQWIDGGVKEVEIDALCDKTSESITKDGNDFVNGTEIKVNSTIVIKANARYAQSKAKPTNSDGTSTVVIPAGNCSEKSISYSPYYGYFFTTLEDLPETIDRSTFGNKYLGLATSNKIDITKLFDKRVVLFAVPEGFSITLAQNINTKEDQSYESKSLTLKDAGGTGRSYTLFIFELAAALGNDVQIKAERR